MNVFLEKPNKILPKILIGIFVFVFFIGTLNLFQNQFKNFFYSITQPFQKILLRAGDNSSNFLGAFLKINNLAGENEEIKKRNQELLEEIITLQQVKVENQALKEVVSGGLEKEFKLILTEAIGIDNKQDFILINRGSDDGILEDMPVINSQKVLFGKVFKVYKNFSKVMLVSSKNSVLDVKIQKDDTISPIIYGAVRGEGNLSAILDLVSLEREIKNNDILITSSLEGTFPKGLLIGKITEPNQNDLKPFQTAKIELFFNLKQSDKLFIISDYKIE
jgi:rod shape-determining protein MreC